MLEFTLEPDGTVRFEGMTRDEVDAEAASLDMGGRIPEGLTPDEMMSYFEGQNRFDELFDVLEQWPPPEALEAAAEAAKKHGVTRVEVQLPPRPDDD